MNFKKVGLIILLLAIILSWLGIITKEKNINYSKDIKNNDSLAIMVFDKNQNKYVKQSTNSFPMGAYQLNTELSHCDNGTALGTYDPKTGTMTSNFNKSDKCYYYFDIGKITPTLTVQKSGGDGMDYTYTYSYDGDGIITCVAPYDRTSCTVDTNNKTIAIEVCASFGDEFVITTSETEIYKSVSTTIIEYSVCLYPDTLIDYYDRKKKKKLKKKIKDIEDGDEVYTYNPETGMTELKKVKKVTTCKVKEAVVLTIKGEELIIAKGHPVYIDGIGLLDVALVKENYKLIGNNGIVYIVDKVEIRNFDKVQIMYNLLLEGGSNMIIGKVGILCMSLVMLSLTGIKDVSAACDPC